MGDVPLPVVAALVNIAVGLVVLCAALVHAVAAHRLSWWANVALALLVVGGAAWLVAAARVPDFPFGPPKRRGLTVWVIGWVIGSLVAQGGVLVLVEYLIVRAVVAMRRRTAGGATAAVTPTGPARQSRRWSCYLCGARLGLSGFRHRLCAACRK